jgi:hypothetical protein
VVESCVPGTFFLQPHVFLCRAKRYWVILDVNRDKYLCVDRHQFESLGPSMQGWDEAVIRSADLSTLPDDAGALAARLVSLGILSKEAGKAKDARPVDYPLPVEAFDLTLTRPSLASSCAKALPFFRSSARASRQLRGAFHSVISLVQTRKRRDGDSSHPFDVERARSLTAVFDSLRWFYPRPYLCLFDSLALIHFLAHFGLYPDWVFGVTADPFEAHCWVQAGGIVLNDTVERTSGFTPIMVV